MSLASLVLQISLVYNRNYFLQINFGTVNDAGHILKSTVMRQGIVGTWFVAVPFNRSSSKKHRWALCI